jgi:broad specificity phosphatase PhoE
MTMVRLQTIRHGLTTANVARICGSPDDALAEAGERQAAQARARLDPGELGRIISSPLPRAIRTAMLVTGCERDRIAIHADGRERDFGGLSGLTHEEAVAHFPEVEYRHVQGVAYSVDPPGGETLADLRDRAAAFLVDLHRRYDGERVTLFSHGNLLQQLRGQLMGVDALTALELPLEGILNLALMRFDFARDGRVTGHAVIQLADTDGITGLY